MSPLLVTTRRSSIAPRAFASGLSSSSPSSPSGCARGSLLDLSGLAHVGRLWPRRRCSADSQSRPRRRTSGRAPVAPHRGRDPTAGGGWDRPGWPAVSRRPGRIWTSAAPCPHAGTTPRSAMGRRTPRISQATTSRRCSTPGTKLHEREHVGTMKTAGATSWSRQVDQLGRSRCRAGGFPGWRSTRVPIRRRRSLPLMWNSGMATSTCEAGLSPPTPRR